MSPHSKIVLTNVHRTCTVVLDIKDTSFPLTLWPITSKAIICHSWLLGVILCCWYSIRQRFGPNLTGECFKVAVKHSSSYLSWGDFYLFIYIQCECVCLGLSVGGLLHVLGYLGDWWQVMPHIIYDWLPENKLLWRQALFYEAISTRGAQRRWVQHHFLRRPHVAEYALFLLGIIEKTRCWHSGKKTLFGHGPKMSGG